MTKATYSFTTGLRGLDAMLHGLAPGDNVVLQVGAIEDYPPFVQPYVREAVAAGTRLIYFRFARHAALLSAEPGIEVYELHPEEGFERFINEVVDIVEQAGLGVCYVFDCLSDLAVDWYSDRMLGNFFRVACPFLYKLDTIAYFAVLRNNHSSVAIDAIANTAQVVMTVYTNRAVTYVQPQKVFQRFSPTMFMLHRRDGDDFQPVTSSATTAEILTKTPQPWLDFTSQRPGVWHGYFLQAREALDALALGKEPTVDLPELHHRLLRMTVTRDERFLPLVARYFPLDTVVSIIQRMIGTGMIGGKSLGMLLARAILEKHDAKWSDRLEPHDSFFIGSDVFYTYLVQNDCWWLRRQPKNRALQHLLETAEQARERILRGTFPDDIQHQFMEMLGYFGQSPIIVRSSSLLEDQYGNAFSGKYESVFCTNQGTPEQRLAEFMNAVRTVYASAMSRDALVYRADRGLLGEDEQMALLVQRVSGAIYGDSFFPQMAGVGFSFNPYVWNRDIDPRAGLLRLVFGLGTRAVDRSEDDYTRLVALNAPMLRPEAGEDTRKYGQRYADVLDLRQNRLLTQPIDLPLKGLGNDLLPAFAEYDHEMSRYSRERGIKDVFPWRLSFDGVFRETEFIPEMTELLAVLHQAYNSPVDVEFTVNYSADGQHLINLLQCRPFQVKVEISGSLARLPEAVGEEDVLIRTQGPIIGPGLATAIDRLVYIVPAHYSTLSTQRRYAIAHLLGRLTHLPSADGRRPTYMLVGPGRWGTRSPSLGVPVTFAEIDTTTVLCELAVMHKGLIPDVSLGTHFFNDLVEMDMIYMAVFPEREGNLFAERRLLAVPNRLASLLPDAAGDAGIVHVIDSRDLAPGQGIYLRADPMNQSAVCYVATAGGPAAAEPAHTNSPGPEARPR